MNIRFVAQDLAWSPSMKQEVEQNVATALARELKTADFELSMHLKMDHRAQDPREPQVEMWAVLQTFDGHCNEIVRRTGQKFHALLDEVSDSMRLIVRKKRRASRYWLNPFRLWPLEGGALISSLQK